MRFNRFVAILILLFSFLSCNTPSMTTGSNASKPAQNVIFIIGDGMGLSQITAGMYHMNNRIVLEKFPVVGLIKTHATGNMVTDSAAGATAFATGDKTENGKISVDPAGNQLQTIAEKLSNSHNTGLAVTSTIAHATPACYYAHNSSRKNYEEIALSLTSSSIDVAIGFGRHHFTNRKDGRDLLAEMSANGFNVYEDLETVDEQSTKFASGKLAVLLSAEPRGVSNRPDNYLLKASELAIDYLSSDEDPFFLMIEASQVDWAGHANQKGWLLDEMEDFDKTVKAALDFAQKDGNTLVLVTADHETGGLGINAGNLDQGNMDVAWTTGGHTATMVPVFAYGPGAEKFGGIYDNTDIYYRTLEAMGR